jgi:hypothetical protein
LFHGNTAIFETPENDIWREMMIESVSPLHKFSAYVLAAICIFSSATLTAQESRNQFNQLLLPTSRKAHSILQSKCQLWSLQQLERTVSELERQFGIHFWIDRRIDPSQSATLQQSSESLTLGTELERIAVSCGAAGGLVENVYVIAPANRLARIQRAAVVLHGQIASSRKQLAADSRELSWTDITTSQELLDRIKENWGIELIDGTVPHDLHHQGSLPQCSLATQLSLLLGGFDLQASLENPKSNGGAPKFKIQPLATAAAWQDTYLKSFTPTQLEELKSKFPQITVETQPKSTFILSGETNAHIQLLSPAVATTKKPVHNNGKIVEVFNLPNETPVENVLNHLAERLKFTLEWSEECTSLHRARLVKLKAENISRPLLLERIGKAAGLVVIDQGSKVVVSPK